MNQEMYTKKFTTNDEARAAIAAAGITTETINIMQIRVLWSFISREMKHSNCFNGCYKMDELTNFKYLTCSSDYFEGREAVSFNDDGFIGFAGWASSSNAQPILDGVAKWLESMEIYKK